MDTLADAKPDFISINYCSTTTVAASKNDGTDAAPRGEDQQVMIGEEGVYRSGKIPICR